MWDVIQTALSFAGFVIFAAGAVAFVARFL